MSSLCTWAWRHIDKVLGLKVNVTLSRRRHIRRRQPVEFHLVSTHTVSLDYVTGRRSNHSCPAVSLSVCLSLWGNVHETLRGYGLHLLSRMNIPIQVRGTQVRQDERTCLTIPRVDKFYSCWDERSKRDWSLRLVHQVLLDETTSSSGMIYITRPNQTDRESLLLLYESLFSGITPASGNRLKWHSTRRRTVMWHASLRTFGALW